MRMRRGCRLLSLWERARVKVFLSIRRSPATPPLGQAQRPNGVLCAATVRSYLEIGVALLLTARETGGS